MNFRLLFLHLLSAAATACATPVDGSEARFSLEVGKLSASEIRDKISGLTAAPASERGARLYLIALEGLGRVAGPTAYEVARDHPYPETSRRGKIEAVLRGLASTDCDAAEKWLSGMGGELDETERTELNRVLLQAEARSSPAAALQRGRRLAAGDLSNEINHALAVVEEMTFRGAFEEAHRLASALENEPVRQAVLGNLAGLAADHRPDLAIAWWQQLPTGDEKRSALFRVLDGISNRDLTRALAVYGKLDEAERSLDLLEATVVRANAVTTDDFDVLSNLVPAADRDRILLVALLRQGTVTPDAIDWARFGALRPTAERNQLLLALLRAQAARDAAAADSRVETFDFLSAGEKADLKSALRRKSRR